MFRLPNNWEEIPDIDELDAEDDEGQLRALLVDANFYNINDIQNFELPNHNHNITETIFVIKRNNDYYLCETQGENYVKFSARINNVPFLQEILTIKGI